jgi:hypothetical protein
MTRGWLAVAAVGILVLAAASVLLAPAPADIDVPERLETAVADGRASLLDHLDLVEPGTRPALTGFRCRDDGGVLLFFTNRWLWLVERDYYVASDGPPDGPGSFGGGVLDLAHDAEVEVWSTDANRVDCATGGWPRCAGDGYDVGYPMGWFVHPADVALGIGACTLFAAQPFEAQPEGDGGWDGASIALWHGRGCRGSFEVAVAHRSMEVDGRPAVAAELEDGHGVSDLTAYQVDVQLAAPQRCEASEWLVGRTESDDPGGLERNRPILDAMLATLEFERPR